MADEKPRKEFGERDIPFMVGSAQGTAKLRMIPETEPPTVQKPKRRPKHGTKKGRK